MDLLTLRYFLTVADAGSLSAAAAQLRLAQPSLSAAMRKLERDVEVTLLIRGPRGVQLTDAGRYLVEAATRILGDVDDAQRMLTRFAGGIQGTLTFAAAPALMWQRVPRMLRAFARATPGVDVRLHEAPPWTALDMLRERRADAAALLVADPTRFHRRYQGEFALIDWGLIPIVAALPAGDPLATSEGHPVALTDLAHHVHLLPPRTAALESLPEAVDRYFARCGLVPERARTVESIQTALIEVAGGAGVALVPDADDMSLRRFDVASRPLAPRPEPLHAMIAIRAADRDDPTLARLIDAIRKTATGATAAPSDPSVARKAPA